LCSPPPSLAPLDTSPSLVEEIRRAEGARAARSEEERAADAWRKLQFDFPVVPDDELAALAAVFRWA
jgi:hypothetical protein